MKRILPVFILVALSIYCLLWSANKEVRADSSPFKTVPPILDNSIDPMLHLDKCIEYEQDWRSFGGPRKEKVKKNFKSKKWTEVRERWSDNNGGLTIMRWYFDNSEDAILFPFENITVGSNSFSDWDEVADIGHKTYWAAGDVVLFAKGKVLVKVMVSYRLANARNLGKEYTEKVARSIEKKL